MAGEISPNPIQSPFWFFGGCFYRKRKCTSVSLLCMVVNKLKLRFRIGQHQVYRWTTVQRYLLSRSALVALPGHIAFIFRRKLRSRKYKSIKVQGMRKLKLPGAVGTGQQQAQSTGMSKLGECPNKGFSELAPTVVIANSNLWWCENDRK